MEITKELLKSLNACTDGYKYYLTLNTENLEKIIKCCLRDNHFDYANWLYTRLMSYKQCVQYAVHAAELVLPVFEKQFPDDDRPRKAIEAAKNWIENPTEENKKVAYTAYSTAASADCACSNRSACIAAYSAYYAAGSAYYAAGSAANSACYARRAAYAAFNIDCAYSADIYNYGLKLLEAGNEAN